MAQIVINEISANYMWNIGTSSYATVALPITSQWGPGYFDPAAEYGSLDSENIEKMLENTVWRRFPATQEGLESFVSTYRGPADCSRLANDNSYQMATTLLTAGYDVLTCRICPGSHASGAMVQRNNATETNINGTVKFRAKYPGTFGNNIQLVVRKLIYLDSETREKKFYWNIITYVVDSNGIRSSVENKVLVFDINNATDTVPYYEEVESNYWEITEVTGTIVESNVTVGSDVEAPNDLVWNDPAFSTESTYVKLGVLQKTAELAAIYPAAEGTDYNTSAITPEETAAIASAVATAQTAYDSAVSAYNAAVAAYDIAVKAWEDAGSPTDSDAPTKEAMDAAKATMDTAKDTMDDAKEAITTALNSAGYAVAKKFEDVVAPRFTWAENYQLDDSDTYVYPKMTEGSSATGLGTYIAQLGNTMQNIMYYQEWVKTHAVGLNQLGSDGKDMGGVYDLLKDKLSYNPNRVVSPGWDDQDFTIYIDNQSEINDLIGQTGNTTCVFPPSPLHLKLMDVAYYSRCATGYIDVPKSVERRYVHIEDANDVSREGYVQKLARVVPKNAILEANASLFTTHCGFFAPWGQYPFAGSNKMTEASPSMLTLLIQRAQILNQASQYEWALPTNRKHNLRIGKMDYTVPNKVLNQWQKREGASVNVITNIPDLGTNLWGNSTLFEVPPATYQALANLSTRLLVNAVEDMIYRCGISITFQYNNAESYSAFNAGMTPLLDTMKNVGAIEDYRIRMSADINGEDMVNANSVIGKVWLIIPGVINDITCDLIALPSGLGIDLSSLS